jgi:hypothetical protein
MELRVSCEAGQTVPLGARSRPPYGSSSTAGCISAPRHELVRGIA